MRKLEQLRGHMMATCELSDNPRLYIRYKGFILGHGGSSGPYNIYSSAVYLSILNIQNYQND